MDYKNEEVIDDILKKYGYCKDESLNRNKCKEFNSDVEGGFQDVNPLIFVLVGEVMGDLISGSLPFNVANTLSNIIILVGQIIETYGTQQLYYEHGPGRRYEKNNRNIDNPECTNEVKEVLEEFCHLKDKFNEMSKRIDNLEEMVKRIQEK